MQVTFDISKYPDLVLAAKEILNYYHGKTQAVDLKTLDGAISDLEHARRTCDEVHETSSIELFKFLEPVC
ncbi:hypothetical protein [Dyadobacter sandarakinus]|uniref:Uncharacterized protein n=1 Tax=Dyadobacter sandarakinus TaxID=2747268 RepID=A0ABX7I153_9BACT|nr:hypothetical protein [Dyadobacter sandarakinus]QRQ99753.1 hypothetical protein HWI92_01875 [Dyadobacter sandarakinus]